MPCTCLLRLTKLTSVCFCRNEPHILKELLMNPSAFPHPIPTSPTSPWILSPKPSLLPLLHPSECKDSKASSVPSHHTHGSHTRCTLHVYTHTAHTHHTHCMCTRTCSQTCMHLCTHAPEQESSCTPCSHTKHANHMHKPSYAHKHTHLATTLQGPVLMPLGQAYLTFYT